MGRENSYEREIKSLLVKLLRGNPAQKEIVRLAHITSSIAESYFQEYYPSFLKICAQEGLSESDLAEDSILQIFARGENGSYYYLKEFEHSLNETLDEIKPSKLYFAYSSYVQTVALRRLIKTHGTYKKTESRIYRNIRDYIRDSNTVILEKDHRGYFIRPAGVSISTKLPAFPFNEMEQLLANKSSEANNIPELLQVLHSILKNQSRYRRTVSLYHVVLLIKRHYVHIADNDQKQKTSFNFTALSKSDLEVLKSEIIESIQQKIVTSYVIPGKITIYEANDLFHTLLDIIGEWFDETKERSPYFKHAERNLKVSEAVYDEEWRTKIEYLARIARKEIELYFMDGL